MSALWPALLCQPADACLLPDLTPFEHNVVKKSAFLGVVSNVTWALMDSALNAKLLAIANNDPIAIAKANSIHWSVNAALQLFLSPLGEAASGGLSTVRLSFGGIAG